MLDHRERPLEYTASTFRLLVSVASESAEPSRTSTGLLRPEGPSAEAASVEIAKRFSPVDTAAGRAVCKDWIGRANLTPPGPPVMPGQGRCRQDGRNIGQHRAWWQSTLASNSGAIVNANRAGQQRESQRAGQGKRRGATAGQSAGCLPAIVRSVARATQRSKRSNGRRARQKTGKVFCLAVELRIVLASRRRPDYTGIGLYAIAERKRIRPTP